MVNIFISTLTESYTVNTYLFRFFNDQEIKNTPKTKVESKQNLHTLTLPKAELNDEGIYKCVATNPDGTVETKAKLSVCSKLLWRQAFSIKNTIHYHI